MQRPLILGALVLGTVAFVGAQRRSRARRPSAKLRAQIESAVDEVEKRTRDQRKKARKLRGEARRFMEQRANELEVRRKELQERLETLASDAIHLLERSRESKS